MKRSSMLFRLAKEVFLLFCIVSFMSCYRMRASNGGGQISSNPSRIINAQDIAVHPGYKIEPVATGLNFPTSVAFDDQNNLYVVEAGYSYGEVWTEPRLLRVENNGKTTAVVKGPRNGPWTSAAWYKDAFYISEDGQAEGGRILRVTKEGAVTPLVSNLPSVGDHHTNSLVVKDEYVYFGQGTATNSGVVGTDNAEYGWLKRQKTFHDIPCKDVVLVGQNYESANVLASDSTSKTNTGTFVPFGTTTSAGQVIRGTVPCSGAVMRIPITGGAPELVAWGLRNPYGLAVANDGRLFATENAFDDRGSRPVWGAGDVLWEIKTGSWYGWPDFSAGKPIQNDEEFKVPGKEPVKPLLQQYPGTPPKPAAIFGVHASANGIDFSRNQSFGYRGEAFVAEFGDMAPKVGKVLAPVGYKIVRVDANTGIIRDFVVNKGKRNGPASWLGKGGLERPIAAKFDNAGAALYIVDFGIMKMSKAGPEPQQNTGVIWKVTKQ